MKWGGWCSCSCWLESEEMRRTRKKWSWQWRWLWNIAETCEHTHKDQFRLELNIHQISEHNHSDGRHSLTKRLWTIVNYRKLSWTIVNYCEDFRFVKCFWVAGDLTVLDWDLPAPRGFGVLRGDWRGLGVALRRWEAPRALVGVGGFEALRVLCHALVAAQNGSQDQDHLSWPWVWIHTGWHLRIHWVSERFIVVGTRDNGIFEEYGINLALLRLNEDFIVHRNSFTWHQPGEPSFSSLIIYDSFITSIQNHGQQLAQQHYLSVT